MKKYLCLLYSLFLLPTIVRTDLYDSLWGWNNHTHGYYENIPQPRHPRSEKNSACGNGQSSSEYGYACPHLLMFSADLLLAAQYDHFDRDFYYAVAGGTSDQDCGACYQVQLLDAEQQWDPLFRNLIVQVVNSGFDVRQGQFDVFMGGGGFGWFTSCNSDCFQNYCKGGPCHENLYDGSFSQWNNAQYYDSDLCYSGGIKWLNHTTPDMCHALSNYHTNDLKDRILFDSCMGTNRYGYHQNFVSTNSLRVQCPPGLYRATGLRRSDEDSFLIPHLQNQLPISCRGNRDRGDYCITTMMDCCKFSCSWNSKGNPDPQWSRTDTCNRQGLIYDYF